MPIVHESRLSEADRALLEFEATWSNHSAAKEEAIREAFALSAARYYQLLNAVIDSPAAVRYDPMLVGRVRRARDARVDARSRRAFTGSPRVASHGRAYSPESSENNGELPPRPV